MSPEVHAVAPDVIGVVADDFTGAADSAGTFARHGWTVRLLVGAAKPPRTTSAELRTVVAIATGSRSMSEVDAAAATSRAVHRLAAAGAQRLFVKIDSTLRGPVAGQVQGALEVWGDDARVVVAPAFPAQGRTVINGVVLVDGVPVSETASGRDPFAPVASDHLADLFPGFRRLALDGRGLPAPTRTWADAATDRELDAVAEVIGAEPDAVAVGSAGLAGALARRWSHPSPPTDAGAVRGEVIVIVTSLHPVSALQMAELAASAPPGVDLVTPPVRRESDPARVADQIAERVSALVRARRVDALVVVGGDGVAAVLDSLGATGILVDDVLETGCPTGTIVGGIADGTRIVTKSGGFGTPQTLVDLVSRLRRGPSGPDRLPRPADPKEDHHD
ncbi:four-carbon acid sugar kinase family protein [uncultured Microbacterium sp.]|uniref:four-carbon acid sugar kinase family protein n=1 Tax=uncultured Microbacterium sp. TaxID=191216 RepID=UPI0025E7AA18|nr:four-carbon acid sugar kinase family protein [uncultured Microbacterium sp.]